MPKSVFKASVAHGEKTGNSRLDFPPNVSPRFLPHTGWEEDDNADSQTSLGKQNVSAYGPSGLTHECRGILQRVCKPYGVKWRDVHAMICLYTLRICKQTLQRLNWSLGVKNWESPFFGSFQAQTALHLRSPLQSHLDLHHKHSNLQSCRRRRAVEKRLLRQISAPVLNPTDQRELRE